MRLYGQTLIKGNQLNITFFVTTQVDVKLKGNKQFVADKFKFSAQKQLYQR